MNSDILGYPSKLNYNIEDITSNVNLSQGSADFGMGMGVVDL